MKWKRIKCGKVFAALMTEAELNGLIEQFRKERLHDRND